MEAGGPGVQRHPQLSDQCELQETLSPNTTGAEMAEVDKVQFDPQKPHCLS